MSLDAPDPEYLTHYSHPVIHDDLLDEFINKVKSQLAEKEDLFSNDKDLFRLIGLLTNADRKVLNSAYVNRKKLKKGGMQDILLNLVKEMWVAGLVFEKWDAGQHGRNSTHIWTRMNRVIKIIAEDKQKESEPDTEAWSAKDHAYAMKQQKEELEVKHDDERREMRREKEKAEKCAREWKKVAEKNERLWKKAEACLELPDSA